MQSACVCGVHARLCVCVRARLYVCVFKFFCTHVQTGYVIVNECVVNALHTTPHSVLVFTRWHVICLLAMLAFLG